MDSDEKTLIGIPEIEEAPTEAPAPPPPPVEAKTAPVQEQKQSKKKSRFQISILFKLIAITIPLMMIAGFTVAHFSGSMFSDSSSQRASDALNDQADTRAVAMNGQLKNIIENMKLISAAIGRNQEGKSDEAIQLMFEKNSYMVTLEVIKKDSSGKTNTVKRLVNNQYLEQVSLTDEFLQTVRESIKFPVNSIFASTDDNPIMEVRNSSSENGIPMMTIGIPYATGESGEVTHITLADIRLDLFQKIFTVKTSTIYAIDKEGTLIAHPEDSLTVSRQRLVNSPIVLRAINSSQRQGATRFEDPQDNQMQIGAYAKTDYGITVIAQAPESIILEDANLIRHKSIGITMMVLSGAVFFIILFALTFTAPIERLDLVTKEIAKGNFDVKTGVKTRDEVGQLAETIDEMVVGLIERDKAKTMISKFHGDSVMEDMMAGEIELKGEKKDVTVFFSDIRDFTKFSEGHSPEEVVAMLNEYFAVMVEIINRNNGMVDKFIGDAIMAVWGTQTDHADQENAIKACLEMRMALEKLNDSRIERGLTEIRIGIGIHCGEAISGTIGSDERMEYTVIGDTVNMAARIEASTKAFGTDLLVSEDTEELVRGLFWPELAGTVEVKGKAEPLKLFKIMGTIEGGEQKEWRTRYSEYSSGKVDKVKVA